ncbi:MAG: monovalent cation/H+ antiporter complex subunit F [Synergistales bacterium]|nr:monovalent cation/H+ antiporter complex subunit F [Synergistales bacterium]MDY6401684.1 monovalent cation/H+ antiporter complex subunit F [Synergistales bacterium]MDY6404236.1 monovalent cation/H+ antiporter complex subunit F [Synergistales bacterium]MDY6411234.1 monovalent cation/H+ antiporter complex subunit F [Synergistales bacterium]MDY6415036.1 monovalent cation/H+ antiporter complex subunit F [Synergistales bacterium]
MPDENLIQHYILIVAAIFLSASIFICLMRATLGPRFSDRIIAANIVGTKIILLIAVLAVIIGESYLADVCLVYAIISFLSIVVLGRSVIEKREEKEIHD